MNELPTRYTRRVVRCYSCGSEIRAGGPGPLPVRTTGGVRFHYACWERWQAREPVTGPVAKASDLYPE